MDREEILKRLEEDIAQEKDAEIKSKLEMILDSLIDSNEVYINRKRHAYKKIYAPSK